MPCERKIEKKKADDLSKLNLDSSIYQCKRLTEQIQSDEQEMSAVLKGDILESYRDLLQQETAILNRIVQRLRDAGEA